MQTLQKGIFFGASKKQFLVGGLTIVHSSFHQYTNCPWHYHQNAHFAFTLKGTLTETHKHQKLLLSPGCLMYNHSQEPHFNADYSENVAALHVDIDKHWFEQYDLDFSIIEGVHQLINPVLKNVFYNLLRELRDFEVASPLAVEEIMIQAVSSMIRQQSKSSSQPPAWVPRVKDLLYAHCDQPISLSQIAQELNIHPVYLCQQFAVHFHCSFGEYIRKIRIEKAVEAIMQKGHRSLTDIALSCGFADQSHFIRTFKRNTGITPLAFKKLVLT